MTVDRDRRQEIAALLADHLGGLRAIPVDTIQRYSHPAPEPNVPCVQVYADDPFLARDESEGETFCDTPTEARYVALVVLQGDVQEPTYDLLCEFATTVPAVLSPLARTPGYELTIDQVLAPTRATTDPGSNTPRNLIVLQITFTLALPDTNF